MREKRPMPSLGRGKKKVQRHQEQGVTRRRGRRYLPPQDREGLKGKLLRCTSQEGEAAEKREKEKSGGPLAREDSRLSS